MPRSDKASSAVAWRMPAGLWRISSPGTRPSFSVAGAGHLQRRLTQIRRLMSVIVNLMSGTVNTVLYAPAVGRWEPGSKGRLQEAALALYSERGFDQTTAAQIADRAGLTERTFFRHYADKREVLFGGAAYVEEKIVAAVTDAPPSAGPLEAVGLGLQAGAAIFGEFRRDLSRQRQAVIAANPELHERELSKLDSWAGAIAEVLHIRGVGEPRATLAAETGMAVLRVGMARWASEEDDRELTDIVCDAMADVRALAADV